MSTDTEPIEDGLRQEGEWYVYRLKGIDMVSFNEKEIILDTKCCFTNLVKKYMNKVSRRFGLDYKVKSIGKLWFVEFRGDMLYLERILKLRRKGGDAY